MRSFATRSAGDTWPRPRCSHWPSPSGSLAGFPAVEAEGTITLGSSYAEWRRAGELIVDGQRVRAGSRTKWSGSYKSLESIPLGHEVRVTGLRQPDGAILASEIDVRENGTALFETRRSEGHDRARRPLGSQWPGVRGRQPRPESRARRGPEAGARGRSRPKHRPPSRATLPRSIEVARLRDRQQGVECAGDGQRRHLDLPRHHGRDERQRARHRHRPRVGALHARAFAAADARAVSGRRSRASPRSSPPRRSTAMRSGWPRNSAHRWASPRTSTATAATSRIRPIASACATPTRAASMSPAPPASGSASWRSTARPIASRPSSSPITRRPAARRKNLEAEFANNYAAR